MSVMKSKEKKGNFFYVILLPSCEKIIMDKIVDLLLIELR